tara:strand:- start:192 stop:815 length:624 start_codon:yes stop_codon:yes gene_type:complete
MARFLTGSEHTFSASMYGHNAGDYRAKEYLQNQYERVSSLLTETSSKAIGFAKARFEEAYSSGAMRIAKAASRKVRNIWTSDDIFPLLDVGALQQAKPTMQRWVMAEPGTRKLWQNQQLDGYSGTYIDMHPGDIGEDHYDYRRVMNGVMVEQKDGSLVATNYFDDLVEEEELDFEEQDYILDTWEAIKVARATSNDDWTSKWNAERG